jgi:hypothetical protein
MFEETDDAFIWSCDTCGLVAEFIPLDFYRSLSELKNRGWSIARDREGQWTHRCRRCRKKTESSTVAEFLNRKPERKTA